MERKKKYKTEEERKAAQRVARKRWREKHKEEIVERQAGWNNKYRSTKNGRATTLLNRYKANDRNGFRDECTITAEWIKENILNSKCVYCGETDWMKLGCDRIDNNLPHTPENCVCSCWDCNNKRNRTPYDEFMKMIGKIA